MRHLVGLCFFFFSVHILFAQEKLTLLFAGDLMQHTAQIQAAYTDSGYTYEECFRYVKDEISQADIAIGNLEVTLGGHPYTGYPTFSAPDAFLTALQKTGFDVLLTANNHCLDRGRRGLERTVCLLDSLKIAYAGTYVDEVQRALRYPLCIEKNGFVIALLNYTYGTNGIGVQAPNVVNYINREQMQQDILKAKRMNPDAIIACLHWGTEYQLLPESAQRELADWLLSQGVNHVVGGHPHVLQPMELRPHSQVPDKQVVVYSLGNCISNMSARHTDGGAFLKLELIRRMGITRLHSCRYALIWTSRPVLSGKKNFCLYPINIESQLLTDAERQRMYRFVTDARILLDQYNIGIDEYVF